MAYGDNPNTEGVIQASGPRDPDKFDADDRFATGVPSALHSQRSRQRDLPGRLSRESPRLSRESPFPKRLFDAYAAEVARVEP